MWSVWNLVKKGKDTSKGVEELVLLAMPGDVRLSWKVFSEYPTYYSNLLSHSLLKLLILSIIWYTQKSLMCEEIRTL